MRKKKQRIKKAQPTGQGQAVRNAGSKQKYSATQNGEQEPHRKPNQSDQVRAALDDLAQGYFSVAVPEREKGPKNKGWQGLRLDREQIGEQFQGSTNRGLLLGSASGGLADVDLDCHEAIRLAAHFLPKTERVHGRKGKRRSHYWYTCSPSDVRTRQFKDVDGAMLVELRGNGGQTLVPPSVHPKGEPLVWHSDGKPAKCSYNKLLSSVSRLAAAALLVRHWSKQGSRHEVCLALAGVLLRNEWDQQTVSHFIRAVAEAAGDEELDDRVACVPSTAERLETDDPATGFPKLIELLGEQVVRRLSRWLNLSQVHAVGSGAPVDSELLEQGYAVLDGLLKAGKPGAAVAEVLGNSESVELLAAVFQQDLARFNATILGLPKKLTQREEKMFREAVKQAAKRKQRNHADADRESDGESGKYHSSAAGLSYERSCNAGAVTVQLTNFDAKIVEEIRVDDGVEPWIEFRVWAKRGEQEGVFTLPAAEFNAMNWPSEKLGVRGVVFPNQANHARTAIQLLSDNPPIRHIYVHTGWREIDGQRVFLHGDGAIGPIGPISEIEVKLQDGINHYVLPPPPSGRELREYICQTLALRHLAPLPVTCSLEGATFRAPLGGICDCSVFLTGQTGTGKSEVVARYQQHFGAGMHRLQLPGSFASTANALERSAFYCKDVSFTVDDYCPSGTPFERQRYSQTIERLIRSQRNNAGRQRMTAKCSLRPATPPRGIIIGTGEDVPPGHSLRASMMIVELLPGDLDWLLLSDAQRLGEEGVYARTMAAFIQWLAGPGSKQLLRLPKEIKRLRDMASNSPGHRRTPELTANLLLGNQYLLLFAKEKKAIDKTTFETLWVESLDAIDQAGKLQSEFLQNANPALRFMELLRAAISSKAGHLANENGESPRGPYRPGVCGWERVSIGERIEWRGCGKQIGWVTNEGEVYLEPTAAFQVAQEMGKNSEGVPVQEKTLHKRLREADLLASSDTTRQRCTVRKQLQGTRRAVLHLVARHLLGKPSQSSQSA